MLIFLAISWTTEHALYRSSDAIGNTSYGVIYMYHGSFTGRKIIGCCIIWFPFLSNHVLIFKVSQLLRNIMSFVNGRFDRTHPSLSLSLSLWYLLVYCLSALWDGRVIEIKNEVTDKASPLCCAQYTLVYFLLTKISCEL